MTNFAKFRFDHCPKYMNVLVEMHGDRICDGCECLKNNNCSAQDYIHFGDFCYNDLDTNTQNGYYMLEGLAGYPELGKGLRRMGDKHSYHSIMIQKDDAEIFKQRVKEYRNQKLR